MVNWAARAVARERGESREAKVGKAAWIGFVSHNWGVVGHLVYANWVRFAFLILHRSAVAEIGFVLLKTADSR